MTKQAFIYLFLFLFMGVASTGCFGCFDSDDDESSETVVVEEDNDDGTDEAPENLAEAMDQVQGALQKAFGGEGGTVKESVDFRELKDLLPEEVDGLERTSY